MRHFRAYKGLKNIRRKVDSSPEYFAIDSDKTRCCIVVDGTEIAVISGSDGARISMDLMEELVEIYKDVKDYQAKGLSLEARNE